MKTSVRKKVVQHTHVVSLWSLFLILLSSVIETVAAVLAVRAENEDGWAVCFMEDLKTKKRIGPNNVCVVIMYVHTFAVRRTARPLCLTRALCALVKQARPSEQADNSSV